MTPQDHVTAIRNLATTEEATAYVAGLKGATLDAVAALTHCVQRTADGKRAHIVQALVGCREDWAAIHSPKWRP